MKLDAHVDIDVYSYCPCIWSFNDNVLLFTGTVTLKKGYQYMNIYDRHMNFGYLYSCGGGGSCWTSWVYTD